MKKFAFILVSALILSSGTSVSASPLSASPDKELITPFVVFTPDRCIVVDYVKTTSSGYEIIAKGGKKWNLSNAAKEGFKNPKTNAEVEIMLDIHETVVGWRVL